MVDRVAKLLRKELKTLKKIALMLGGGSSITAVKYGKTIDTSMEFTPTEGLISSTESKISIFVVKVNEEIVIVRDAYNLVKGLC